MANNLLNKLKSIDNSRVNLQNILKSKHIETLGNNSLPSLVESVNLLQEKNYVPPVDDWTGIDVTPPKDYYKPEIDLDAIYNADKDKDNYTCVAIALICVDDGDYDIPKHQIYRFDKFKFSDEKILENCSREQDGYNNAHVWDRSKDIVGPSGKKYRYIIGYTNSGSSIQFSYLNLNGLVIYKGDYANNYFYTNYYGNSSEYVEIKPDVIRLAISGYSGDNYNYKLKTFISKCPYIYSSYSMDNLFVNCKNLRYVDIKSLGTTTLTNIFVGLRNCYVRVENLGQFSTRGIADCTDCTFHLININGDMGGKTGSYSYDNTPGPLDGSLRVDLKIDSVKGITKSGTGSGKDCNMIIDCVDGDLGNLNKTQFNHLIVKEIHGQISSNAFENSNIQGNILLTGGAMSDANLKVYSNAFKDCKRLESVEIKDSNIKSIESYAFSGCSNLKQVKITNATIAYIGEYAFQNCNKLDNLVLNDTLETFKYGAISGCYNLKSIIIPINATISNFYACGLEHIVLGDNIVNIPENCFSECRYLKSISLPKNLATLGAGCFKNTKLETIELPANITQIPDNCFKNSALKSIKFKGNISTIGENAFYGCTNLNQIDLTGVNVIKNYAFKETNVDLIYPSTATAASIGEFTFNNVKSLICESNCKLPNKLNLANHNMDKNQILKLFKSLPINSTTVTLTVSPNRQNGSTNSDMRFWSLIKDLYVKEVGDELQYCESSEPNSKTLAAYMSAKNYTVS